MNNRLIDDDSASVHYHTGSSAIDFCFVIQSIAYENNFCNTNILTLFASQVLSFLLRSAHSQSFASLRLAHACGVPASQVLHTSNKKESAGEFIFSCKHEDISPADSFLLFTARQRE